MMRCYFNEIRNQRERFRAQMSLISRLICYYHYYYDRYEKCKWSIGASLMQMSSKDHSWEPIILIPPLPKQKIAKHERFSSQVMLPNPS